MPYKDKEAEREATKDRVRRYRKALQDKDVTLKGVTELGKKQGVTEGKEGITEVLEAEGVTQGAISAKGVTEKQGVTRLEGVTVTPISRGGGVTERGITTRRLVFQDDSSVLDMDAIERNRAKLTQLCQFMRDDKKWARYMTDIRFGVYGCTLDRVDAVLEVTA